MFAGKIYLAKFFSVPVPAVVILAAGLVVHGHDACAHGQPVTMQDLERPQSVQNVLHGDLLDFCGDRIKRLDESPDGSEGDSHFEFAQIWILRNDVSPDFHAMNTRVLSNASLVRW